MGRAAVGDKFGRTMDGGATGEKLERASAGKKCQEVPVLLGGGVRE